MTYKKEKNMDTREFKNLITDMNRPVRSLDDISAIHRHAAVALIADFIMNDQEVYDLVLKNPTLALQKLSTDLEDEYNNEFNGLLS